MASSTPKNFMVSICPRHLNPDHFLGAQRHVIKWKINDLTLCNPKTGDYLESRAMGHEDKIIFRLRFFYGGDDESCKDFLSLHIFATPAKSEMLSLEYTVSILSKEGQVDTIVMSVDDVTDGCVRISKLMRRELLVEKKDHFMPSGSLSLLLKISVTDSAQIEADQRRLKEILDRLPEPGSSMQEAMARLFESKVLTDFTICANDTEIRAHKLILSSRWPTFKAAVSKIPPRRADGMKFQIDPVIMNQILYYLYTGEKPVLADESSALAMLKFTHQYGVRDLKEFCMDHVIQHLSRESVLKALILAYDLKIQNLREKCIQFICDDKEYLNQGDLWKPTLVNHPQIVLDILDTAISGCIRNICRLYFNED